MGGGADENLAEVLIEELGSFALRPYDFVYWAFPWGEAGTELERRQGPEDWQKEVLFYLQQKLLEGLSTPEQIIAEAIQIAVRSGHDIGKSACVCWIIIWAISTREDTKGVVTANTEKQLRLKLWAELAKWHRLFLARQFFKVTATSIQASDPEREKEWRIDAIPWSEDNPEAFAGLHNFGKRVLVIFDEASGIVDKIWETIDGVMNESETELIWIATGNPTRNIGRFRECFEPAGQGQFWHTIKVDSRQVSFTNKDRIQRQIDMWGIDSDFIKVRWLGEFPESGMAQLIPSDWIRAAMLRDCEVQEFEPKILGVDVARMGDNESVAVLRSGKNAKGRVWRWRKTNTMELADHIAAIIVSEQPDAVFIDEGNVGGALIDRLRQLGHNVIGVNFGGSPGIPLGNEKVYNKRAEMYCSCRYWLGSGGCIPNDPELQKQLTSIEYGFPRLGRMAGAILLTPKEEMEESPDWADALVLTFAFPVAAKRWRLNNGNCKVEYDPLSYEAFAGNVPTRRFPTADQLRLVN